VARLDPETGELLRELRMVLSARADEGKEFDRAWSAAVRTVLPPLSRRAPAEARAHRSELVAQLGEHRSTFEAAYAARRTSAVAA
jgi:hypothetical protein